MACASSPSRRRGCTVPAHVRVTGQTGQCAAGTGTCTAVGKEGTRGRPRRYRLLPTRPARQASTPYAFVFDSYSRLQEASTARPALAVTPRCTERRTENAGGENLLVKARHAAIPVCARFRRLHLFRFWNLIIHRFGAPLVIKPQGATPRSLIRRYSRCMHAACVRALERYRILTMQPLLESRPQLPRVPRVTVSPTGCARKGRRPSQDAPNRTRGSAPAP